MKLGVFWNKRHLTGPFWRLYHHDDPGAGLCVNGKRIEILPGSFYILPPHCNRLTWCSGVPFQLYIHFELSMSMGNPRFPYHVIPLTDDMRPVLTELRQSLKGGRPDCLHNSLLAIALCSRVLSQLPPEALLESGKDRRMETTCDFLRDNLNRAVDLEMLASRVRMTPNAFSRLFRKIPESLRTSICCSCGTTRLPNCSTPTSIPSMKSVKWWGSRTGSIFRARSRKSTVSPPAQYRRNYSTGDSLE